MPKRKNVDQYQLVTRAAKPETGSRDLLETLNEGNLRCLSEAKDVLAMVSLALPGIETLARKMAAGEHHDPQTARRTKESLNGLLKTIEAVCDGHRVRFADALAYLHPADDLLVGLSLAAGDYADHSDPTNEGEGRL